MKFTAEAPIRFNDDNQETARRNANTRIAELQKQMENLATAPGRVLGQTVLTGSGNDSLPAGTRFIEVQVVGGGGGGGGAAGGAGVGVGGGGASGAFVKISRDISGARLPISWSCGVGGVGGTSAGGSGGTGGDTRLLVDGGTMLAKGGGGGAGGTSTTTIAFSSPGGRVAGSSKGDYSVQGVGDPGIVTAGTAPQLGWGGAGGSNPVGAGGGVTSGSTAGGAGDSTGAGGGGAGGCSVGATGRAGGNGAAGKIIVVARG